MSDLHKDVPRSAVDAGLPVPPPTAGLDVYEIRNEAETFYEPQAPQAERLRWPFLLLFFLAFVGMWVPVLSPVVVTLAVKVNALVGPEQSGTALGTIVGIGALGAFIAQPLFGRLSDMTTARLGMRRPWVIVGFIGGGLATLGMALAPNVATMVVAFSFAQLSFNAAGAGLYGVLADQVPQSQRGLVSGLIGCSIPVALPLGTFLVQLVAPNQLLMFLLPLAVGAIPLALFVVLLKDRRLAAADRPTFSLRTLIGSFWVNPLRHRDFGLAWWAKFLFIFAYSFLTTYQTFFLINELGKPATDVPTLVFQSTLVLSATTLVSSFFGGKLSDVMRRRKIFVIVAAVLYGVGLYVIATSGGFNVFLIGIAIAGFGFGWWAAVDTALTVDVLPSRETAAKDMGVANIATVLPQSLAPAIAPLILAASAQSYPVLYGVAAACAVVSALFIIPIRSVR